MPDDTVPDDPASLSSSDQSGAFPTPDASGTFPTPDSSDSFPKTRTSIDFMRPATRGDLIGALRQQLNTQARAAVVDAARAERLPLQAARQASAAAEDRVVADQLGAAPKLTATDVANDPALTPDARAAGQDPIDLFDPSKPNYVAKPETLAAFQTANGTQDADANASEAPRADGGHRHASCRLTRFTRRLHKRYQ